MRAMLVRALTTLIGLACAAALLLLVPDTGSAEGGGLWKRAMLLAAAGFVAGFFYQLGGVRRPGVRVNVPVLVAGVLPWTLLAIAICAQRAGTPAFLTDLVRDVVPGSALRRWSLSFPILAFTSGLLLAFALVEPRVVEPTVVREDTFAAEDDVEHADEKSLAVAGPPAG